MIIRRDINDIWDVALTGQKKLLGAFRNCQTGYRHFFDVSHPAFTEANFKGCRCAFSSAIFVANLDLWVENNIPQNLTHWLQLNMKEPIYFGAATPPLLAVFYENYQNLASIPALSWNHTHSLGTKQKNRNMTYIKEVSIFSIFKYLFYGWIVIYNTINNLFYSLIV